MVQSTELTPLYKMVARAMESSLKSDDGGAGPSSSPSSAANKGDKCPAITLKCIPFPHRSETGKTTTPAPPTPERQLYVTVALMEGDWGPTHRRCFHCTLTDRPQTHGWGGVTPGLFALLRRAPGGGAPGDGGPAGGAGSGGTPGGGRAAKAGFRDEGVATRA